MSEHRSTDHRAVRAGSVVALWRYPVKSMVGERLAAAAIDADGIDGDRRFAVGVSESGKIASAKRPTRWGPLLRCHAGVSADGVVRVTLPGGDVHTAGHPALDQALSQLLGRRVHLEHVDERDAGVFAEAATAGVVRITDEITVIQHPPRRLETTPTAQR